ncbi:MAG: DUF2059 domain-containing protein, partial [Pseudomonadota bacterium]|nr:DUF2059 domain-containing protein [Pseudomonadota bacterium]
LFALMSAAQAADRAKVEAFLKVTGFDVAIDSIALSATSAPDLLGMNQGDFGAQWTAMAEDVFDTDFMQNRALDILEATLEDDLLAHAAAFYASDLGQRLVDVENSSHMADDEEKDLVGNAVLADLEAKDDPRVDLFRRMSVAIDPNAIGPKAMTEIQVRFILAASYAGVIELRTDEDGLRALLNENAEEMAEAIETSSLANAAYTYRDFTLEELVEYTEALEHPDMMTVYELMNAVHFEVMSNRFEALALRMGDIQPVQDL